MRAPLQTPDDDAVDEIVEGLLRFVDSVVLPIESQHAALLNDPRRAYDEPQNQTLFRHRLGP